VNKLINDKKFMYSRYIKEENRGTNYGGQKEMVSEKV